MCNKLSTSFIIKYRMPSSSDNTDRSVFISVTPPAGLVRRKCGGSPARSASSHRAIKLGPGPSGCKWRVP